MVAQYQRETEIDCPMCGKKAPMRVRICPHCEAMLH